MKVQAVLRIKVGIESDIMVSSEDQSMKFMRLQGAYQQPQFSPRNPLPRSI